MNNKVKYEYKELPNNNIENKPSLKNDNSIAEEAIELFGEDMISIN